MALEIYNIGKRILDHELYITSCLFFSKQAAGCVRYISIKYIYIYIYQ